MSKFGALLGGFGTGFAAGQRMKLDRERADRENKTADLQNQAQQRALDKDQNLQDAYQDIANEAVKRSGVQIPAGPDTGEPGVPGKQPSAQEALGFALHSSPDLFKDREFLNTAASAFLSRGLPEGVKWLEAGHKASQEGYTQALQALMNGDKDAAVKAFATSGKLRDVTSPDQLKDLGDGKWEVTANGKTSVLDPKQSYINLLPPKDFAEFQMKAPYYKALSEYQGGRNEASIERAGVTGQSRENVADINAESREGVAGIRAYSLAARGVGGRAVGARGGGTAMYGGDKGAAKWVDDFEKHYMPKSDVKNADGTNKINPKDGQPVQEVDQEVAPIVRDLARVNNDVLAAGGVHPQEAANVFTQFAKAYKTGDRAKMFAELDKAGRVAIVENDAGDPVKAVGIMGQYRDARGQTRPMFFDLPEGMSTELITQETVNRVEKQKAYPDESKRGAAKNTRPGARAASTGVRSPGASTRQYPGAFGPMQPNQ
ncbi:MAG: hypothetical protein AABM33_05865 [Pseudomonadota bacterium]